MVSMFNKQLHSYLFAMMLIAICSCSGSKKTVVTNELPYAINPVPDYSDLYYWAAHPYKNDLSDSTPEPFKNFVRDSTVDVFFIHPTTYVSNTAVNELLLGDTAEQRHWNASVNDVALNNKTDQSSMLFQASAFNHYRVFAPRYRQAHYNAFFINDTLAKPFFDTAYEDVKNAFIFYLQHYNNGRPFIIASHSQGTLHASHLIKDMIEHTPLMNKLVAAYIIGLPVLENYFTQCLPCSTPTQTGCFVSWRTFRSNYIAPWVAKEKYKAVVVNPLTWRLDTLPAIKKLNNGAVLFKFNKPMLNAVSATINGNILWASKPHFFGSIFFTNKNYHVGDINLFWKNIRDNVDERVTSYRKFHN
ncbi:hypothetical protein BH10BAC3_BH10BAC3_34610 [soil metagenome]